jgi:hypothetical protein
MIYTEKLKLSDELRIRIPDLFSIVGAVIQAECSYPQPFGNAWLVVKTGNVLLRFVWDRGFASVQYQHVHQQGGWREVHGLLSERTGGEVGAYSWEQWCDLVKANFDVLKNADYPRPS